MSFQSTFLIKDKRLFLIQRKYLGQQKYAVYFIGLFE